MCAEGDYLASAFSPNSLPCAGVAVQTVTENELAGLWAAMGLAFCAAYLVGMQVFA